MSDEYTYTDEELIQEAITIAELFQEELDILVKQHTTLIEKGTTEATLAARDLSCVIKYFKARLGQEETDLEELYGADPDRMLH
jgi:hypothetical protein